MHHSQIDRLPPIASHDLSAEQSRAWTEFEAARGYAPRGPFVALLRSPQLLGAVRGVGDYLRFHSVIGPRLTELAILVTAAAWRQAYEWNAHVPRALAEGLTPAIVAAIGAGEGATAGLSGADRVVHDYCIQLNARSVDDAVFNQARDMFGEQGVVEISALCGYYGFIATLLNAANTPVPANASHHLPERRSGA